MIKFWWKGEPLIVGSLHHRVIDNDLKNNIYSVIKQLKTHTTINEAVKIAHSKGFRISFNLQPKRKTNRT